MVGIVFNPTSRNTKSGSVLIATQTGGVRLYYSYNTLIAVAGGPWAGLRECACARNKWGPTTGRHMNEMRCRRYPEREQEEVEELALRLIAMITLPALMGDEKY